MDRLFNRLRHIMNRRLVHVKAKKSGTQPLFSISSARSHPDIVRSWRDFTLQRVSFFGVVGQTQFVGFAPPTQTLGWQISTFSVFSLLGFIYLTCLFYSRQYVQLLHTSETIGAIQSKAYGPLNSTDSVLEFAP
jgi:hypothetical protein